MRSCFHVAIGLVSSVALSGCRATANQQSASQLREQVTPAGGLGQETPQPDEDKHIQRLVDLTHEIMQVNKRAESDPDAPLKRDVHTKSHGCLRGIFEVRPDLPSDFVTGVFQAGARYPVTARTSNGVPGMQADSSPSTRGFAVKLLEVEGVLDAHQVSASEREWLLPEFAGLQQDFTFLNGKSFIIKDLETYVAFTEGLRDGRPLGGFISLSPSHPRFKPMQFKTFVESVLAPVSNPLHISYYGQLPHRFKDTAAKYRLDTCAAPAKQAADRSDRNFLRSNMKTQMKGEPSCYVLSVILQKDPVVQPIEDSHVEWLSDDADIKAQRKFANRMEVGRFIFPPQEFDTPPMERMCEAMSYSPWHSIAAHRPLGNMQRARKAVYLAGASLRPSDRSPQKADGIHQEYLRDFSSYGLNRE